MRCTPCNTAQCVRYSRVFGDLALYLLEESGIVRKVPSMHPPSVARNTKEYLSFVGNSLHGATINIYIVNTD